MCRPTAAKEPLGETLTKTPRFQQEGTSRACWSIPAWLVFLCLPLVPTSIYINRGYTQWFHGLSVLFVISRDDWFCRFLAVQGLSITLGWYASMAAEFILHGRFAHVLYHNMPEAMTQHMVDPASGQLHEWLAQPAEDDSPLALSDCMKILAHVLDLLGHPILTYYYWSRCWKLGHSLETITTWSICVSAYLFSRLWSLTHCRHNFGIFEFFYFGYDVYALPPDSVHLFIPSYLAEFSFFLALALYKLQKRHVAKHTAAVSASSIKT